MQDTELADLRNQLRGMGTIPSMALSTMGMQEEVHARIGEIKSAMRQENAPLWSDRIIKSYRIAFQGSAAAIDTNSEHLV
ncbi:hypothetical protein [Rhizobium sp. SYY.PMSO]|uniref:hypothetical protein n=1 Tax=Rhizobium sp. SYY.PMSO TaxID=3382192 RepID=UPI00398F96B2